MVSMSFQNGLWYCNDEHVKCTYVQSLHWIYIKWNPMYIEVLTSNYKYFVYLSIYNIIFFLYINFD